METETSYHGLSLSVTAVLFLEPIFRCHFYDDINFDLKIIAVKK
jgi:hypothetical protein